MNKTKASDPLACRRNKVGGQAVLEGVMMKAGERVALAVRMPDGRVKVDCDRFVSARKKAKILNVPIIRGMINFVEMMILSFRTLEKSAEALGIDDLEESRFEKWLREKFGKGILDVVMVISTVLGLALGVALFALLPTLTTRGVDILAHGNLGFWRNIIEGLMRIVIFVAYIAAVALMPDIRRTYEYHGAEHKSIACYESGLDLTPENARKCTRFHPRCGTSYIFVILILSIIVGSFVTWSNTWLRVGIKLLLFPLIVGVGFEFIMAAGKSDSVIVKIATAPGLWMQRITTREPTGEQLAVAICALKTALVDEFPDFDPRMYDLTGAEDNGGDGSAAGSAQNGDIADSGTEQGK